MAVDFLMREETHIHSKKPWDDGGDIGVMLPQTKEWQEPPLEVEQARKDPSLAALEEAWPPQ